VNLIDDFFSPKKFRKEIRQINFFLNHLAQRFILNFLCLLC
jgi:hypothetical protein